MKSADTQLHLLKMYIGFTFDTMEKCVDPPDDISILLSKKERLRDAGIWLSKSEQNKSFREFKKQPKRKKASHAKLSQHYTKYYKDRHQYYLDLVAAENN